MNRRIPPLVQPPDLEPEAPPPEMAGGAPQLGDFQRLTPDVLVAAVEAALGRRMLGFTSPLASYINRVYEMQAADGERLVAKAYRPGRWSRAAILDEHAFIRECAADEIPVVEPLPLADGSTLGEVEGILFAVFPKRRGRPFEAVSPDDWRRLGSILARMHNVGARHPAPDRIHWHPDTATARDLAEIGAAELVTPRHRAEFAAVGEELLEEIRVRFGDGGVIRIHGDCHRGNILERPGEGLLLVDFDDMLNGPPVQDLWLLLPDTPDRCRTEIDAMLDGYEAFREFDYASLRLVEPLRAMRMLYFLAWRGRQVRDPDFKRRHPDWGGDAFWRREIADLRGQLHRIRGAAAR